MVTVVKTPEIFESLRLDQGAWLITDFIFSRWGTELTIHGQYHPLKPETRLHFTFKNCQHIEWESLNDEIDEMDTTVDVIGMELGQDHQRKPAVITTRFFEIVISYGELTLHKDW